MSADPEVEGSVSPDGIDAGNYDVIRARLVALGQTLATSAERLNTARTEAFGSSELAVRAQSRVRTEHNCLPRDILHVGGNLLFGYNVLLGLKQDVALGDVFSVHTMEETPEGIEFPVGDMDTSAGGFLADPAFRKDFGELYKYYRETELEQLRARDGKLLAVFRYGKGDRDLRVFRWNVMPDGRPQYVDNRGERDHVFSASHSFSWIATTREDHVAGRHPHVSILDELFVEAVGGDLTVKIENNTEDGKGIYAEPVNDANQTLDDARIEYAKIGGLILVRVRPYNEEVWRHLVYNPRAQSVKRIDAIGHACLELPEEHGIIFPGGYYLQSGDHKIFGEAPSGLQFHAQVKSPNGEDVLYVFYTATEGRYLLLPYNLIRKEVQAQLVCNGYSLFDDGRLVVFRSEIQEPTRVHPMQVWTTPFVTAEFAASAPTEDSFYTRIGNPELVRGISEGLSIARMIDNATPTRRLYEDLISANRRMLDNFYWLGSPEAEGLAETLESINRTSELIVDEFEKVVALQRQASVALQEASARHVEAVDRVLPDSLKSVQGFMEALSGLRTHRGQLITLRDIRYVDLARIDALEEQTVAKFDEVSHACVKFMLGAESLAPLVASLTKQEAAIKTIEKTSDANAIRDEIDKVGTGLEVLSEVIAGLEVDDPTARTTILEGVSEVFGQVNRVRATLEAHRKEIAGREGRAEFGAQFTLFGQTVQSGLSLSDSPEKCDEQLSRLLLQLEELEGRFSEFDEYLTDLAVKRGEVVDAFEAKKQTLLEQRQRRVESLVGAAERIMSSVARRSAAADGADALNAYFAADPMVMKLRQVAEQLRDLGDSVKADELLSKLKSTRQDAMRGQRDRADLFEDGANTIKLGKHKFSVNTQPLDLTVVPKEGAMALHLGGTGFYEMISDPEFLETRAFWGQNLVSETPEVYRGEYLAATLLFAAEGGIGGASMASLREAALSSDGLSKLVRDEAGQRYDEGYERGLHDADATLILQKVLQLRQHAGLLRFGAGPRALACLFWAVLDADENAKLRDAWERRARNARRVRDAFSESEVQRELAQDIGTAIAAWVEDAELVDASPGASWPRVEDAHDAGAYLVEELMNDRPRFATSADAVALVEGLHKHLDGHGGRAVLEDDLGQLEGRVADQVEVALAWLRALVGAPGSAFSAMAHAVPEAAALLLTGSRLERETSSASLTAKVEGLLGQHPRIASQTMSLRLDEFLGRLRQFVRERVPAYRAYRAMRQALVERERERLRLDEYMPRVMSSFVRNRLINEVYLPIIGDNLAKQIGALGAAKRTDLMGLLLLISPPGYGKTTLMEYVANRLGLVFMKINGPSLGHGVHSLDPDEAPNATARQEVLKVNLAFEMGSNVMLYLDDIQHTHPEFLQKFISLCDATRRIEGVWNGKTRTYDLRGKKFIVVMAGNPYTESGDKFQIPDMLANRADTYNLGDVLDGREEQFALSYVENALTSNPVLAPLAARGLEDTYRIVEMAQGKQVQTSELSHAYSAVELAEMQGVLRHMFAARDLLLAVNLQYIRSAAQADEYRTEPKFQLQGSYRNMNKIAEKIVPAMNEKEVQALLTDHYLGESQTLTVGAEQNLLKLAEMRGTMSAEEKTRWEGIKAEFARRKMMGGAEDDPVSRMTGAMGGLIQGVQGIQTTIADAAVASRPAPAADPSAWTGPLLAKLDAIASSLNRPTPSLGQEIAPVLRNIDQRLASAHQRQRSKAADGAALETLARSLAEQRNTEGTPAELVDVLARLNATLGRGLKVDGPVTGAHQAVPGSGAASAQMQAQTSAQMQAQASAHMQAQATADSGRRDAAFAAVLERMDATLRLVANQQAQFRAATSAQRSAGAHAAVQAPAPPRAQAPALTHSNTGANSAPASSGELTGLMGQQAAIFERAMMPLVSSATRQMEEGLHVNRRLVELLDVIKLYVQHMHKMKSDNGPV